MKEDASKYLYNEAIKYLGRYPATKKKIKEFLKKRIKNKKIFNQLVFPLGIEKDELIDDVVNKLDSLKIINEEYFIESMFNYYQQSLFSIRKIRNKLYLKGFDEKIIDEYIFIQLQENPELEKNILKKYIKKKQLEDLEVSELKKKLYQQSFSESSIYKILKE
jgi:SOS response regulatory protein OraA/RecX